MQSTNIEWNKLRFLVVEDDKDMRNIIVRLLLTYPVNAHDRYM